MKADKTNSKSKDLDSIKDCCVSDIGLSGFAECQMAGPNLCPYAMAFGYGFLCRHPQLEQIMKQSKGSHSAVMVG